MSYVNIDGLERFALSFQLKLGTGEYILVVKMVLSRVESPGEYIPLMTAVFLHEVVVMKVDIEQVKHTVSQVFGLMRSSTREGSTFLQFFGGRKASAWEFVATGIPFIHPRCLCLKSVFTE